MNVNSWQKAETHLCSKHNRLWGSLRVSHEIEIHWKLRQEPENRLAMKKLSPLSGGAGALWCLCWLFLVYDDPSVHPRISDKERSYIQDSLAAIVTKKAEVGDFKNWAVTTVFNTIEGATNVIPKPEATPQRCGCPTGSPSRFAGNCRICFVLSEMLVHQRVSKLTVPPFFHWQFLHSSIDSSSILP